MLMGLYAGVQRSGAWAAADSLRLHGDASSSKTSEKPPCENSTRYWPLGSILALGGVSADAVNRTSSIGLPNQNLSETSCSSRGPRSAP